MTSIENQYDNTYDVPDTGVTYIYDESIGKYVPETPIEQ